MSFNNATILLPDIICNIENIAFKYFIEWYWFQPARFKPIDCLSSSLFYTSWVKKQCVMVRGKIPSDAEDALSISDTCNEPNTSSWMYGMQRMHKTHQMHAIHRINKMHRK